MGEPAMQLDEHFTYKEYKNWPEEERWELIHGTAWAMSPAPRISHQMVLRELSNQVTNWLMGKPCRPFFAPVDVFWPKTMDQTIDEVDTVTQPDFLVVCDPSRIRDEGIWGPPDLVVEILSPSTAHKDLSEKRELCEAQGVREYWVVNYRTLEVIIYTLKDDRTYGLPEVKSLKSGIPVGIIPGLEIKIVPDDLR